MFGERHPSQPVMAPPNPFAGNQDEAMLAYAAAYAQYMQRIQQQPQQQHAIPMYAPVSSMPLPQQHVMPMHVAPPMAYGPPLFPKKQAPATSRRAQAADTGPTLWTSVLSLLVGVAIGIACARQQTPPQGQQQSPQQKASIE